MTAVPLKPGQREKMNATIYSWPGLNSGTRIPYVKFEDGKILHLHHLCGWEEGEQTMVQVIHRDHETRPIVAVAVNDRETMILSDDQMEYIFLSNRELLDRKIREGAWTPA